MDNCQRLLLSTNAEVRQYAIEALCAELSNSRSGPVSARYFCLRIEWIAEQISVGNVTTREKISELVEDIARDYGSFGYFDSVIERLRAEVNSWVERRGARAPTSAPIMSHSG